MATTLYVIDPDPDERARIRAALTQLGNVAVLDDGAALLASRPGGGDACLVVSAEPDARATLELVRELRRRGSTLPVIVLGPHSAFRTAVDIARLEATDFLERPVTARQLRAAVRKALQGGG